MAYDLAAARQRVGLDPNDTSNDAMLKIAMNAALGEAQRYCNRSFYFAKEKAEFLHFKAENAQLSRYPIRQVFEITIEGRTLTPNEYHVHNQAGRVLFDKLVHAHMVTFSYEGGYIQLPSELEIALWLIFDLMWAALNTSTGTTSIGPVKTISVPDVGSITYGDSGVKTVAENDSTIPNVARSILDLFRLETC